MLGVVAYILNPSTERQRQIDLCEFEARQDYRANSRIARATQ